MKVIDFFKRQAVPPPARTTSAPARPTSVSPPPTRVTPEDLIEDAWTFAPVDVSETRRVFSDTTVQHAAAIYSARQMRRIADDIEAIRKHLTRLRVVPPPDDDSAA